MRCQQVETNKRLVLLPSWVLCLGQFCFAGTNTFVLLVFPNICTIPHVRSTCFIHLPYELSSPYVDAVIFIPYIEINIVVISLIL